MKLLLRYIFANHAKLLLMTMAVGAGLYLLTEMVERVDTFVEAGSGWKLMVLYFGARLPAIVSQILPAVFLLASVITLCLMVHSREMIALQAGGVSPLTAAAALVLCGLFWGVVQFSLSQWAGSEGDRYARRVWREEVKKRTPEERMLLDVWFTEGDWIVSMNTLLPGGRGTGFTGYKLSPDGLRFDLMARAPEFSAASGAWRLLGATVIAPEEFTREGPEEIILPLGQDPGVFFLSESDNPQTLPLWLLGEAIKKLRGAGSNVEELLTAWHGKLAYAASLAVMAVLAAAIVSFAGNIYLSVALSIAATFLSYALTLFGESLGRRGILPPALAAWGPNLALLLFSFLWLRLTALRR